MTLVPASFDAMLRNAIGYDPLFRRLAEVQTDNYPPHNIEKIDEDHYRLTLAVAGFAKDDLEVSVLGGFLTVSGTRSKDEVGEYLYRGIALRSFSRKFTIGEHVEVVSAQTENGLLVIDLERRVPEALKPRSIEIR